MSDICEDDNEKDIDSDESSIDYNEEYYILTVYQILQNEPNKNSKSHIISYVKKYKRFCSKNDTDMYKLLKSHTKQCIKTFISERLKLLHDEIIIRGGFDKYTITEIYRYVCSSVSSARQIANKQIHMVTMSSCDNSCNRYQCYSCKYRTNLECHWLRHQTGKKHIERTNVDDKKTFTCCVCNATFFSRVTLWRHKKICVNSTNKYAFHHFIEVDKPYVGLQNEFMEILQQNQILIAQNEEFKELLMEQHTKMMELSIQPTTTTIVNNNHNHNNFNLNFFLNETCKDAMSLTQFVNSLEINTATLEYTGVNGYVAGISKIFTDGLRQLEVSMRPIHCTDLKRETLYIKENDVWEKDSVEKTKFNNALNTVVRKNMQQVREWTNLNPRCDIIDSAEYQLHIDIMKQCVGGDSEYANNRKILRNVAKEVLIDKTKFA